VSTDQFIVKFKEAAGISSADRQEIYARAEAEVGVPANGLRLAAKGAQIVGTGRALDPVEAKDFLANLRANPDVEYAEPDALMYPMIADPNDPFYSLQWDMWEEPGGMRMPGAWSLNKGDGVVVAVVDTGITDHSDLNAKVLPGYDMISSAAKARDNDGREASPRRRRLDFRRALRRRPERRPLLMARNARRGNRCRTR
jgi:serine protease